jgi:dimethylhistidine N-methyltransferase
MKPPTPTLIQVDHADPAQVHRELLLGLQQSPATIPPKYFYDALGSRLFAAITALPEYYPTRTETAIFDRYAEEMARCLPTFNALVDLGAGNCEKASRLFQPFDVQRYVAVDISVDFLRDSLDVIQRHHPAMDLLGVGLDFSAHLNLPTEVSGGPRLMFYPGSSIGNFTPDEALDFLRQVHGAAQGGGLLIGVDLVKPKAVLEAAYDDPLQVTAAFNRNLLRHLNRLVGTDFEIADWSHVAFFDKPKSRIEMHLQANRALSIRWPEGERHFEAGERIHTENSYKWYAGQFSELLSVAGFGRIQHWTDENNWFAVFLAHA